MIDYSFIAKAYGLGTVIKFDFIGEGVLNHNILLETDKGKYFVKGIRGKVANRIPHIYAVEDFMVQNGIPAIKMLATTDGNIMVTENGVSYCCYLFIESDRSHEYSLEDYFRIGAMLGTIHTVSKNPPEALRTYILKFRFREDVVKELRAYKERIEAKEDKNEIDALFLEYINLKLKLSETWPPIKELPHDVLQHGDYHAGNLLINKVSREIVGVCDWEKAEYGARAYELARSLLYIAFDQDIHDSVEVVCAEIVKGYRSQNPIDTEEIIDGLRMRLERHIFCFWIENMYYNEGNTRPLKFIEKEIGHLKMFVEGKGIEKLKSVL